MEDVYNAPSEGELKNEDKEAAFRRLKSNMQNMIEAVAVDDPNTADFLRKEVSFDEKNMTYKLGDVTLNFEQPLEEGETFNLKEFLGE